MKAPQNYKREEGGREGGSVGHKWLVFTDCLGSHIFSSMPKNMALEKNLSQAWRTRPRYIFLKVKSSQSSNMGIDLFTFYIRHDM